MGEPLSTAAAIASILSSVSQVTGAFGGKKGGGQMQTPAPTPGPEAPSLKAPPGSFAGPDQAALAVVPPGLQGLDPSQQRSRVATLGSQGGGVGGQYSTDAAMSYYKNLVLSDLVGGGGPIKQGADFLPVERQFITNKLGKQTYDDSPAAYLDALLRP